MKASSYHNILHHFNTAFHACQHAIPFNPLWESSTGYFDSALEGPNQVLINHREVFKSTMPDGRKMMFVGTALGTIVVFQRYTDNPEVIGCHCAYSFQESAIIPGIGYNKCLTYYDLVKVLGDRALFNVGFKTDEVISQPNYKPRQANTLFQHLIDNTKRKIPFNISWLNSKTSELDPAKVCQILKHSPTNNEFAKSTTMSGRHIFIVGSVTGPHVIYQRHELDSGTKTLRYAYFSSKDIRPKFLTYDELSYMLENCFTLKGFVPPPEPPSTKKTVKTVPDAIDVNVTPPVTEAVVV